MIKNLTSINFPCLIHRCYQNIFEIDDNFEISDAKMFEPGHCEGDCQHVYPHHDQDHLVRVSLVTQVPGWIDLIRVNEIEDKSEFGKRTK